jgi:hypothetical protein
MMSDHTVERAIAMMGEVVTVVIRTWCYQSTDRKQWLETREQIKFAPQV